MLSTIDLVIVAVYAAGLFALAQWVSREPAGQQKSAQDYFLAGKALPWWAIGASLIAANISAEQIIGMSGSGYAIGLAIASYEWMAAFTLLLVGKFLLPIFLRTGIYTMPQFLEQRYDSRVKTVMAVFWLGVYTFVNLTSILWLGALAINTVAGVDLRLGLAGLGIFAVAYSPVRRSQGRRIDGHYPGDSFGHGWPHDFLDFVGSDRRGRRTNGGFHRAHTAGA